MSRVLNFEIALEEKTERKLRALAMLSPEAAQEVEGKLRDFLQEKLAQYFDSTVSDEILKKMQELDGKTYVTESPASPLEKQEEPAAPEDPMSHGLSDDDDSQENPSLAEQAEQLETELAAQPQATVTPDNAPQEEGFQIAAEIEDAGDDAEAFLDPVPVTRPAQKRVPQAQATQSGPILREAGDAFDPRKRRAHISSYGGKDSAVSVGQGWFPTP